MEKKNIMKNIKLLTIILIIILVSLIGFLGVYKQNANQVKNSLKEYAFMSDIGGVRSIKLKVKENENVEGSEETKENETLTEENINLSKSIIEKRLKKSDVENYEIRVNEKNGDITVQIPESKKVDEIVSTILLSGKFEIVDSETNEVLINNNDIKSSSVLYNSTSNGTGVYLQVALDKEGKQKLEEISKKYVKVENEEKAENSTEDAENENSENEVADENSEENNEEKSTEKQVIFKLNDEEIITTSFEEPLVDGKIQLTVGSATKNAETLNDYVSQAKKIATSIDSGNLPLEYSVEKNQFILSNIKEQNLKLFAIIVAIINFALLIVFVIKYKLSGLLASIAHIGLAAFYLIVIRYTNTLVSIESILGIVVSLAINYLFINSLFKNIEKEYKKDESENIVNKATKGTYKQFVLTSFPVLITALTFSLVKLAPISSCGTSVFWGYVLILIYNVIVTKNLLKINIEQK